MRRLVPEVIQTSDMDCGPACLAAVLRGFGVAASYGRLREACQTDVDGTSIDTIEELANELGIAATQQVVPVDFVLAAERPAIVVTHTGVAPHFVVLWNRTLGRMQVMDPARGRRWVDPRAFAPDLYQHVTQVPAEAWRAWAGDELARPLARRLRALGVRPRDWLDRALADMTWRGIAALDAAVRMTADLVAGGALRAGREAARMLAALVARADAIPDAYVYARAVPGDAGAVELRGCVALRVDAVRPAAPANRELAAALREPPPRPLCALARAMLADGALRPAAVALAAVIAALGTIVEVVLFRAVFDVASDLATVPQLAGAAVALVAFLLAMLLVEVPARTEALRLGRRTELRLRTALLTKLPRLGLHYLRSRPLSDMADRAHMLHRLRDAPALGVRALRGAVEIVATAGAMIWLVPSAAALVLGLLAAALVPPLLAVGSLAERELRTRTHAGALARFYLDALLGTLPARAAGIETVLRREHEGLLVEWSRAARAEHRVAVGLVTVQSCVGFGLAIALVLATVARGGSAASLMLVAYWALAIPTTAQLLAAAVRELPAYRNATLRYLEPLGALDEERDAPAASLATTAGVAIELAGVSVIGGGTHVLRDIDLRVAPGEHVAIVGVSGGGKSTLLGLLLGWSRPASGAIRIDGATLDPTALRGRTVWIDPAVTLWNRSLAQNLAYGEPDADVAGVAADAGLEAMIARLPDGMTTRLGEGGGLVSGGEGQRVRIARGLARVAPRLVILDEPFRGLDRDTRRAQLAAARRRWRSSTLLCAMHDLGETSTFSRVLVVERGRIVEDGRPAELAARPGSRYAALLASEERAREAWARWQHVRLADGRIAP
jgi:ABC-type bacteriocin/lantibiotic exporter with double-glycine peptidase domain